ncbi:hypothetical protein GCM10009827_118780 [Dactylosporangium maewongense]|uniref:Uncharacterized protein n=1 Tax=Dactylosporangium maewongense TaxID=634393 RepID=A0ABN2DH76_9ACTN
MEWSAAGVARAGHGREEALQEPEYGVEGQAGAGALGPGGAARPHGSICSASIAEADLDSYSDETREGVAFTPPPPADQLRPVMRIAPGNRSTAKCR